jgi:outer membrane receptor protein involved in Fe transport
VDVIDRNEITEWRPLDLGDIARRYPNVIVSDGGSPFLQIPTIRGFGGDRVKVMTDGVWPSTQSLGFHGSTLSLWDPEATERMEIYHGPGAYLKGIDSPGGVINIVPRRPRRHGVLTADGRLASSYSSATKTFRQRVEADVGVDRVAALIGATWTDTGNRHTPNGSLIPSDYRTLGVDLALDYFLDNQSTIGVTVQHFEANDISSPMGTGLADPRQERTFLALTLSSFDAGAAFHGTRMSIALDTFLQEEDNAFAGQPSGLGTTDDVDRFDFHVEGFLYLIPCHETWAELTVSYAHLDRTETLLCGGRGAVIRRPKYGSSGLEAVQIDPGSTFAVPGQCNTVVQAYEATELVISGILEDQCHTECWDRHFGIRFDYYGYEDTRPGTVDEERILLGAAGGVARHLTTCSSVFGNASIGQRRPTIHERTAIAVLDGKTVFGNPDLDPELHANVEVGLKSSFKDRAATSPTTTSARWTSLRSRR